MISNQNEKKNRVVCAIHSSRAAYFNFICDASPKTDDIIYKSIQCKCKWQQQARESKKKKKKRAERLCHLNTRRANGNNYDCVWSNAEKCVRSVWIVAVQNTSFPWFELLIFMAYIFKSQRRRKKWATTF